MSDVLTQPQAHSTPPPGPNPAELNHSLEDRGGSGGLGAVGGGVPIRGRAITPSHERLQRRMSGYRADQEKAYSHNNAISNALNQFCLSLCLKNIFIFLF